MTSTARRRVLTVVAALACAVFLLAYGVPSTRGALVGTVRNTTNTAASGIFATCTTAATGIGSAWFVHPFNETSGSTAADVSGNDRPGTYARGGTVVRNDTVCPGDAGGSIQLNGSSQFVQNNTRQSDPQTFSVQLWFRTTTDGYNRGGRLIGFGNQTGTTQSTAYDRNLYLSNTGRVAFSVYPGAVREITSAAGFNDGAWHHAVATLAPAGSAYPGMRLYLDGQPVAQNEAVTSARSYDGYWRIGWDNLDGYPNEPRSYYFAGRIAYGAVFTTALTPTQVQTLYAAGT